MVRTGVARTGAGFGGVHCSAAHAGTPCTLPLELAANNFERGAIDKFMIKCKDLGDLTHIVVRAWPRGCLEWGHSQPSSHLPQQ